MKIEAENPRGGMNVVKVESFRIVDGNGGGVPLLELRRIGAKFVDGPKLRLGDYLRAWWHGQNAIRSRVEVPNHVVTLREGLICDGAIETKKAPGVSPEG